MNSRLRRSFLTLLLPLIALGSGCTINPVTGDRELALISPAEEVSIGSAQYLPSQQMQGGEYVRDPALSAYVRDVGMKLAAVSDRDLPYEFVVLNHSVPNAWALPGGKIAINRGLLTELQSEAELAAVLGHEIVHAAARHGAQAMQRGMLLQGAIAIAAVATRDSDYSDLAIGAASLGAQLIHLRYGRGAELESDEYGMRYMAAAGYDPGAAVSLQQTFVRLSGDDGDQGGLATLFASHPPSTERVEQNRQTAAGLPAGGTLGRDAYQTATARLRREAPGYAAIDAARRALNDDDLATARREAERADGLLPDSADADALLGEIELAAGRHAQALALFDAAVRRNDGFFLYHLGKAEAHLALNELPDAAAAYSASIGLLPTASAYYGLGRIAEARGDIAGALEEYSRAAESSGAAGIAARMAILRIDLAANPERYLSLAAGLDSAGQLLIEVGNPTLLPVTDIVLTIGYLDRGQVWQVRRTLGDELATGDNRRIATGLGPFSSATEYDVAIESARAADNP